MKREPGGRRAFPVSSQPATPAANAAEIVTLALDLSATAAAVAGAQRPFLGGRIIHSRQRLTEAYYYIVVARLGRRGCIRNDVCAKTPKRKFVQRLLSMMADSRPAKLLSMWLVLSPPTASSSNGQVLHLVWCNLRALRTLKSSKK